MATCDNGHTGKPLGENEVNGHPITYCLGERKCLTQAIDKAFKRPRTA